ncbi:MAG: arsenate reductase ArsC [Aquificae bacterium]|nr:arsenate reductase ArsC [Aquificota bacterium]
MKKILVLCTGNSCRSIMAEAIINKDFAGKAVAFSAGVNPAGKVNENTKKVLQKYGYWKDSYYSKDISEVLDMDFDLVITVCDNAKESCPSFPKKTKVLHIPFEDPHRKPYSEFEKTFFQIKEKLIQYLKKYI